MTNIFEYAKEFESQNERLYRELAAACYEISVARILKRLAEEEAAHYRVIEEMQNGAFPDVAETSILDDVENVIENFREGSSPVRHDILESEVILMALDLEKKSWEFYEVQARSVEVEEQQALFRTLARQEHDHYRTIEEIRDFMLA